VHSESEPTPLEAIIALCGELLAMDGISADDNFFMLGGSSLTAVEFTEALLAKYQLELSLDAVFECETLADLARQCNDCRT
jgi:enterobactin synthetase component F